MAEEVVATFSGPLNSFSINLKIENAANVDVRTFGISGRTSKFPVTWDSFGVFSGPATFVIANGLDTEVVLLHFANFNPDETVKFSGIDPDFTGDTSSGVRVLDILGARAYALFADGKSAFGEFVVKDDTLQAVLTK